MSNGVNLCTFIGTVGKSPEVRQFPNGDSVCNLSIAVNESWKNKDGEKVEKTEWVNLVFTKKLAEIVGQYVTKGQTIYVAGKLTTRKWQKDGQDRYSTEIVVSEMKMLGGKSDSAEQASPAPTPSRRPAPQPDRTPDFDPDEDLPF